MRKPRHDEIVRVYCEHPLLRRIRAADFGGRCGRCPYRELCNGSRARAYASAGEPLEVVDPRHLEPHEVVGVVGDSLRVGLRKAHPYLG